MKMRYLTVMNKVEISEFKQYAAENQLQIMEAKRILEDKSVTVLQYWDGHRQEWMTVENVVEYRE